MEGIEREGMGKGREGRKEKRRGEGGRRRDWKLRWEGWPPLSEILNMPLAICMCMQYVAQWCSEDPH